MSDGFAWDPWCSVESGTSKAAQLAADAAARGDVPDLSEGAEPMQATTTHQVPNLSGASRTCCVIRAVVLTAPAIGSTKVEKRATWSILAMPFKLAQESVTVLKPGQCETVANGCVVAFQVFVKDEKDKALADQEKAAKGAAKGRYVKRMATGDKFTITAGSVMEVGNIADRAGAKANPEINDRPLLVGDIIEISVNEFTKDIYHGIHPLVDRVEWLSHINLLPPADVMPLLASMLLATQSTCRLARVLHTSRTALTDTECKKLKYDQLSPDTNVMRSGPIIMPAMPYIDTLRTTRMEAGARVLCCSQPGFSPQAENFPHEKTNQQDGKTTFLSLVKFALEAQQIDEPEQPAEKFDIRVTGWDGSHPYGISDRRKLSLVSVLAPRTPTIFACYLNTQNAQQAGRRYEGMPTLFVSGQGFGSDALVKSTLCALECGVVNAGYEVRFDELEAMMDTLNERELQRCRRANKNATPLVYYNPNMMYVQDEKRNQPNSVAIPKNAYATGNGNVVNVLESRMNWADPAVQRDYRLFVVANFGRKWSMRGGVVSPALKYYTELADDVRTETMSKFFATVLTKKPAVTAEQEDAFDYHGTELEPDFCIFAVKSAVMDECKLSPLSINNGFHEGSLVYDYIKRTCVRPIDLLADGEDEPSSVPAVAASAAVPAKPLHARDDADEESRKRTAVDAGDGSAADADSALPLLPAVSDAQTDVPIAAAVPVLDATA